MRDERLGIRRNSRVVAEAELLAVALRESINPGNNRSSVCSLLNDPPHRRQL